MLKKKMLRDIKLNLSQFITIFLMVLIGVMAYSGINAYMSGMQKTADKFYSKTNLQDLNVLGANFSKDDLNDIKKLEHVKDAERKLSLTATTDDDKTLLLNFIESNNISKFHVIKGEKFSADKSGIWLDNFYALENNLKIGDEITIKYDGYKFVEKIVGFINVADHVYDVKDESDREGMRVTIDVRRDVSASVVLNNLYKLTLMQTTFGFNMLAIVNGTPKILSLKQILQYYLKHQEEVIRRRTEFELKKAKVRAHILEGLRIALDHIDAIINIIRGSQSPDVAKDRLMNEYQLSDKQAQAILDMRLVRLTGLERDKVENEYSKTMAAIADYEDILAKPERIDKIIYEELLEIQEKFGDERRTELMVGEVLSIEDEDLIEEENVVVTLTHNGYIKRLPTSDFKAQNRGGRGVQGMGVHDDDFIEHLLTTSTHDELLFFTNVGKVYRMKAYEIPEYGRTAKGIPVINLLDISADEKIQTVINIPADKVQTDKEMYLFFITRQGTVKRTSVSEFGNIRKNGLKAITLRDGDELINVLATDDSKNIIIGTHQGYAVSFDEKDIRSMGRSAAGVRGIRLRDNDYVIGSAILEPESKVFVISENGYGKQTAASEYPIKGRGGKGIKTTNITEKNGPLAGLTTVNGDEDIMVITDKGVMIRFKISDVSETGRATLGVRLINLGADSIVSTMTKVEPEDENENSEETTQEVSTEISDDTKDSDVARLLDAAQKDDE